MSAPEKKIQTPVVQAPTQQFDGWISSIHQYKNAHPDYHVYSLPVSISGCRFDMDNKYVIEDKAKAWTRMRRSDWHELVIGKYELSNDIIDEILVIYSPEFSRSPHTLKC